MWFFRGPGHMADIVVSLSIPLGNPETEALSARKKVVSYRKNKEQKHFSLPSSAVWDIDLVHKDFSCVVSWAPCIDAILRDSCPIGYVFTLRRDVEFCARSQEKFLQSVPKGWAEMGKKLFRTSALSLQNTPQKHSKHKGDGTVCGFESHRRRMNLLTYVATTSSLSHSAFFFVFHVIAFMWH